MWIRSVWIQQNLSLTGSSGKSSHYSAYDTGNRADIFVISSQVIANHCRTFWKEKQNGLIKKPKVKTSFFFPVPCTFEEFLKPIFKYRLVYCTLFFLYQSDKNTRERPVIFRKYPFANHVGFKTCFATLQRWTARNHMHVFQTQTYFPASRDAVGRLHNSVHKGVALGVNPTCHQINWTNWENASLTKTWERNSKSMNS